MCKRFQTILSGVNRLSLLTKPVSCQHTTVIISDILCESYIVSIDVIRISSIMNLYIVNESVDVVTADIDVDRSSNRSMNYPLSD